MSSGNTVKTWRPARFALGAEDSKGVEEQFAVLVLNQPVENKALFLQLCARGEKHPILFSSKSSFD